MNSMPEARSCETPSYVLHRNLKTWELSIVPESSLVLFQRCFRTGDIVKRSLTALQSAVITDVKWEILLEQPETKKRTRSWAPFESVKSHRGFEVGDAVAYGNWIGYVFGVCPATFILPLNGISVTCAYVETKSAIQNRGHREPREEGDLPGDGR